MNNRRTRSFEFNYEREVELNCGRASF